MESHLLQMRGLKREYIPPTVPNIKSHLLQMRGLKLLHIFIPRTLISRIFYRCVD